MKIDVDITQELENEIRWQVYPAEPVYSNDGARFFFWNLKARTLTANMRLANNVYGQKAVSVPTPGVGKDREFTSEVEVAIALAFAFVELVKKEGKRQVAPEPASAVNFATGRRFASPRQSPPPPEKDKP